MTTLALIGVGDWGKNYLSTTDTLDDIEIKYICAQSKQTLDSFPDRYIKILSVEDLFENKQIDGFIIATPGSTHFAIAKKLLNFGFNLLIEKPLTTNYEQALELQSIWQIKKPKIVVGHTYLYNPAYQKFRELFKKIKDIKSISFQAFSSSVRKDISVIWDWGPHPISIMLNLIKEPITEVCAKGSRDSVNTSIRFANGVEAFIYLSWLGTDKIRKLIAIGNNQVIEFDDTKRQKKVSLSKPNLPTEYPDYNPEAPLAKELSEFAEAIKGTKKITSDINLGVAVVKVLSAIEQSVKNEGQSILIR